MGLEKEKKEVQEKIPEGGKELNDQEIKGIAVAVKALIDQSEEKKKVSDQLDTVNKKVEKTATGLEELRKLFCSPDGTICFATQEQLDTYLKAHDEKIGKIGTMLTEVAAKIGTMKPPKSELPAGVEVLEPMTEERRKTLTEEQNSVRDGKVAANDRALNQTSNDIFRQFDEKDKNGIINKADMRARFIKTLSPAEIKSAMVIGCKDGECKVMRGELEEEEGLKVYQRNQRGDFQPIDESEKKKEKDFFTTP